MNQQQAYCIIIVSIKKNYVTGKIISYDIITNRGEVLFDLREEELLVKVWSLRGSNVVTVNFEVNKNKIVMLNMLPGKKARYYAKKTVSKSERRYFYIVVTGYDMNNGTFDYVAEKPDRKVIRGNSAIIEELVGLPISSNDDSADLRFYNAYIDNTISSRKTMFRLVVYNKNTDGYTVLPVARISKKDFNLKINSDFSAHGFKQENAGITIRKITQDIVRRDSTLEIPDGVTQLGRLESYGPVIVSCPDSLVNLGNGCFAKYVNHRNGESFNKANILNEQDYTECQLSEIYLGSGIRIIPKDCFAYSPVKFVQLSGREVYIANGAFKYTENLSGTVSTTARKIGVSAFEGSGINTFTGDKLEYIGMKAFSKCPNLYRVKIKGELLIIGMNIFDGDANLRYVSLPDSVEEIGAEAFRGCKQLTMMFMPRNIRKVGINAFKGSGLAQAIFGNSLEKIDESAFDDCKEIQRIEIPSTAKIIHRMNDKKEHLLTSEKLQKRYNVRVYKV